MNPKIYPFEVGAFKCVSISDNMQPIDCGCVSGIGIVLNGGTPLANVILSKL